MILKNLATSILLYEKVRTTKKRAAVVKGLVDRIITIGKNDRPDLAIRRISLLTTDQNASKKVMEVLKKRYAKRPSGFTSIKPLGMRKGDGAFLVEISLVDSAIDVPQEEPKKEAPKKEKVEKAAKEPKAKKSLFRKKS